MGPARADRVGRRIGDTFGLAIDYAELGSVFVSAQNSIMGARFPLGANETRRWVWDGDLSAGDYGIRGWFNDNTTLRFVQNVAP